MGKFLIVDGSSLLHRAFFALPLTMTNPKGEHTNAVYGFATMFNRILDIEQPDMAAVCFDKSRHTFRTDIYADYKGQRAATPGELSPQFELCKRMLEAMGVIWEEVAGYEADDIIGTLAKKAGAAGHNVLILTGDRDSYQLIDDNIRVIMTKKGISQTELWDKAMLLEHYGLTPAQMIDLKALMGDASDNIPGVAGIGEKTALKLLAEYHDLDNVLANTENITAKALKAKLQNGRESALLSRTLAIIDCNMPGYDDLSRYNYAALPLAANQPLIDFYRAMNFSSLLKPLENAAVQSLFGGTAAADNVAMPAYTEVAAADLADKLAVADELLLNVFGDAAALADKAEPEQIYVVSRVDLAANADFLAGKRLLADDIKPLITEILRAGGSFAADYQDIALAAYLLDPTAGDHTALALATEYLDKPKPAEKAHTAAELAALGLSFLPQLAAVTNAKLAEEGLTELYSKVELPLAMVLAKMEAAGICVELATLQELNAEFSSIESACAARIYQLAGKSFNINSPKQLGEVLFVDMGIPPLKKTKTGYGTGVEVLEQLALDYEIAGKVLEYRAAAKLRSTYAEGLQSLIAADGRIHTTFNQTVTATGRLSSTDPNLQNIPVRTEMGRKLRGAFNAGNGCVLLAADYSQIELRVLADISGDEVLRQSFYNNEDIHARTAAEVLGIAIDEVTPEQRRSAKAVNFGIVYGISDFGLAKDLGISRAAAKEYIDAYLGRYMGVSAYMHNIVEQGRAKGYVETLLGRKRRLPDLNSRNFNMRSLAERTALNTPIQGTAADIIKLAMLKIDDEINKRGLKSKMLLQVHDELIFDVPADELATMQVLVKDVMENAFKLAVPLLVDVKAGPNWYDMQKI